MYLKDGQLKMSRVQRSKALSTNRLQLSHENYRVFDIVYWRQKHFKNIYTEIKTTSNIQNRMDKCQKT